MAHNWVLLEVKLTQISSNEKIDDISRKRENSNAKRENSNHSVNNRNIQSPTSMSSYRK